MLNLNDRLCLNINNPDLTKSIALARDFRCCTRTVKIGPALYTEYGPMAVHSLRELSMRDIILDTRFYLNMHEVWPCIEAAINLNLTAITVNPFTDIKIITELLRAARATVLKLGRVKPLNIIINASLINLNKRERSKLLKTIIRTATTLNIPLIIDYYDLPIVLKAPRQLTVITNCKRPLSSNPLYELNAEGRILPGISDVLNAGATYVILDEVLLSGDNEIMSDTVTREMQLFKLGSKTR